MKFEKRKRFNPDPRRQYKKVARIYPYFLYRLLDKWLKEMSKKGWHIVHSSLFFFWFEKGKPEQKEYFTYGLHSQKGKYDLLLLHPSLQKKYGVKEKKSIVNANESKVYKTIEIDTEKIDVETDVGYKELINDRNRLYLRHFFVNSSLLLISIAVFVVLLLLFDR